MSAANQPLVWEERRVTKFEACRRPRDKKDVGGFGTEEAARWLCFWIGCNLNPV